MIRMLLFAFALLIIGCGIPTNHDKTKSQLNVIIRKEFSDTLFKDGGKTDEVDAWGNEITWEMTKGTWDYYLIVRSNGYDGLPYTSDDVVVKATIPIPRDPNAEGISERFVRGLTRGAVKGVKQGLKAEDK